MSAWKPSRPRGLEWVFAFLIFVFAHIVPAGEAVPVHHATLKNGLRVVLVPEGETPVVAMKLSFRVTHRDEPPGKNGIGLAAFMTLMGERYVEWVGRVERLGGWWDPTNLYPEVRAQDIVLAARDLPAGLSVFREIVEAAGAPTGDAEGFKESRQSALRIMPAASQASPLVREGFDEPFSGNDPMGVRPLAEKINSSPSSRTG